MNDPRFLFLLASVAVILILYWVGTMLINAYFKRKAKFVDDLYDKTKGNTDGKNE